MVELGESVLKAGGIEIWSLGNGLGGLGSHSQELFPRRPFRANYGALAARFRDLDVAEDAFGELGPGPAERIWLERTKALAAR
jgi:hypothetical protein